MADAPFVPGTRPGRHRRATPASVAVLAGGIAVATTLVVGGTAVIGARADARAVPPPAALTPVATLEVVLRTRYPVIRGYAARLEPARRSDLAFETGGTLVEVLVDEGDEVDRGDVLVRMDARELEAERDRLAAARRALDADAELARLELERARRLREQGFVPDESLDEARLAVERIAAGAAEADAGLALVDVRLDKMVLRAPFDATVAHRALDEGATVSPGLPVLELDERAVPRLRVGLPPGRAAELDRGRTYRFVVATQTTSDGAPIEIAARLVSLRGDIDQRTRTVSATFEPRVGAGARLPLIGTLLELRLEESVRADVYEVPLTALVEAERGLWSVLTLDDGPAGGTDAHDSPIVRRAPVRIVHLSGERAWIEAPLGRGATLVAGARHRIVPGMHVRPVGAHELAGEREAVQRGAVGLGVVGLGTGG